MARLAGRAALVTGGAAGIGAATAARFSREGASVAVLDIDSDRGEALCAQIANEGGTAHFLRADVTDVDLDLWESTMGRNVKSAILTSRYAIPEIVRCGGGAVINMSSGASLRGSSPKHLYTASKGAIVALTRAMAGAYVQDNVRVNAICAGRILTARILTTVGRPGAEGPVIDRQDASGRAKEYPFWIGTPNDIAHIAVFLASEESRMITGASIPADGGRSAY
jgi:NAD(P)-dependent dehydrogenase (short-subunit alcohol dehydrogenase family)